jgi:hypothetical protein
MVPRVRGAAIATVAVAGLGLFGTGIAGLAQVDGKLADAADRPVVRDVKNGSGAAKGDCPYREQPSRSYERRSL